MKLVLLVLMMVCGIASAALPATQELRYCGPPPRDANGTIIRSAAVIDAFRKAHPCPATLKTTGACPKWAIDHPVPMACGGCDAVSNMQWLPDAIKSAAGAVAKDRWERHVYANPASYDGPECKAAIVVLPP